MIAAALALILAAEPILDVKLALKEQRDTACGDTLACWKRKVLVLDTTLESLLSLSDSQAMRLDFAANEIILWKQKVIDTREALEALKPAALAPGVQSSWLQSPVLWFAIGFLTATALALGIFAATIQLRSAVP